MQVDELTTAAPMGEPDTNADGGIDINDTLDDLPQDAQGVSIDDIINDPTIRAYIDNAVQQGVKEGIKKALKGTPPKANTKDPTEQEAKQFERMTYRERLNLFKSNPQAYYKLTKGAQ